MRAIWPDSWKTPLLLAAALVADMNRSIAEADRFVRDMTPATN
ncbi:MAG: hypothetical protein ACYC1T_08985 [Sulfuricaulis sp.]